MSIIVYNKDLSNFHEITHAISVQMTEYYNDIGKLTLVLPVDDYNISAIENGGVLFDTQRGMSFTIQNKKIDTKQNNLTVNGFSCNWLLNKRVIYSTKQIFNVEQDIYSLVSENLRGLYNVEVGVPIGLTETTNSSLNGGQVLDEIIPILEAAQLGNKMKWNPDEKVHTFEIYKGRDLTHGIHAVVFSEEHGTAKDLVVASDKSVMKNYIYVVGETSSKEKRIKEVGTAQGDDRNESWLETGLSQEAEETISAFEQRLIEKGVEEIARLVSRETFSVSIDPNDYGKSYSLGDIVSCAATRFGVQLTSRITGVQYTLDARGENINVILGKPILKSLSEVK